MPWNMHGFCSFFNNFEKIFKYLLLFHGIWDGTGGWVELFIIGDDSLILQSEYNFYGIPGDVRSMGPDPI